VVLTLCLPVLRSRNVQGRLGRVSTYSMGKAKKKSKGGAVTHRAGEKNQKETGHQEGGGGLEGCAKHQSEKIGRAPVQKREEKSRGSQWKNAERRPKKRGIKKGKADMPSL